MGGLCGVCTCFECAWVCYKDIRHACLVWAYNAVRFYIGRKARRGKGFGGVVGLKYLCGAVLQGMSRDKGAESQTWCGLTGAYGAGSQQGRQF